MHLSMFIFKPLPLNQSSQQVRANLPLDPNTQNLLLLGAQDASYTCIGLPCCSDTNCSLEWW